MSTPSQPSYLWPSALIFGALLTYLLFFMLYKLVLPILEQHSGSSPLHLSFVSMQAKTPEKNQPSIKKPQPSITKPVKHRAPNKQIATPTEVTAVHPVAKQPAKRPVEKAIPVGQPLTESFRATEENHSRQETIVSSPSTQSAPLLSLPVSLDQLTTIPAFTQPFQPEYPIQMRRMGREGVVEVALLIDQRGKIVETNIIKSAGSAFDKAALDALQKVAFTPGKVNEKQVSVRLNLPIRFVLH